MGKRHRRIRTLKKGLERDPHAPERQALLDISLPMEALWRYEMEQAPIVEETRFTRILDEPQPYNPSRSWWARKMSVFLG